MMDLPMMECGLFWERADGLGEPVTPRRLGAGGCWECMSCPPSEARGEPHTEGDRTGERGNYKQQEWEQKHGAEALSPLHCDSNLHTKQENTRACLFQNTALLSSLCTQSEEGTTPS